MDESKSSRIRVPIKEISGGWEKVKSERIKGNDMMGISETNESSSK